VFFLGGCCLVFFAPNPPTRPPPPPAYLHDPPHNPPPPKSTFARPTPPQPIFFFFLFFTRPPQREHLGGVRRKKLKKGFSRNPETQEEVRKNEASFGKNGGAASTYYRPQRKKEKGGKSKGKRGVTSQKHWPFCKSRTGTRNRIKRGTKREATKTPQENHSQRQGAEQILGKGRGNPKKTENTNKPITIILVNCLPRPPRGTKVLNEHAAHRGGTYGSQKPGGLTVKEREKS